MLLLCSLKGFTKFAKKIGFRRQSHSKSFSASQLQRFADNKISPVIFIYLYTFPTSCFLLTISRFLNNGKDARRRRVITVVLSLMKPLHRAAAYRQGQVLRN